MFATVSACKLFNDGFGAETVNGDGLKSTRSSLFITKRKALPLDSSNMFFNSKQKFRVLIEAENLLMNIQGVQRFGCYTTRYVKAADAEEASEQAIHLAQNELFSTGALLNEHGDSPVFTVSEISRIDSFRGLNAPGRGFSFYPMGS